MSFSDYSLSEYNAAETRPDKPLVVKCTYENSTKRITFSSTRNCSYDLLRQRVEQCFSLSATPYMINYTDDEGEVTAITTDFDLTEAIRYFHPSSDDPPVSSSASILSGRSFTKGKVTLRVKILVDYDGPSLSDTSSLVSLEEFKNRNGSNSSFSFGSQLSVEPDEDARTVSSKDRGSKYDVYRNRGPKTIISGPSMEPLIERKQPSKPPSSDWEAVSTPSSPSERYDAVSQAVSHARRRAASPLSSSFTTESDPFQNPSLSTSPFERLKLEDNHNSTPSSTYGSSTLHTERGAAWLRDQNARTMKSMLGDLPAPSESGDAPAPPESYQLSGSSMSGEIALERNPQGKYYFSYSANPSAASQSARGSTYGDQYADNFGDIDASVADSISRAGDGRPTSADSGWFEAQSLSNNRDSYQSSSSNPFNGVRALDTTLPADYIHPDTPPEVLQLIASLGPLAPPPNPSACSECGNILDVIKYVCSTCGEKKPSIDSPTDIADFNKGKSRQIEMARESGHPFSYPPRQFTAPASPSMSSWSVSVTSDEQHLLRSSSETTLIQKTLPALPPRSYSVPEARIQLMTGYELCAGCIESAGINHALMYLAPGSASPQNGSWPSSPEDAQRALSQLRRSAPSQKGQLRHAFIEKSWGHSGWSDVEQDDSVSCKCSTCDTVIINQKRYKCASCSNFNLCLACYSQVHDIHPSHAFLIVPDKPPPPMISKSIADNASSPPDGEASLTHPGVRCYHCLMDIVGARFHCAICDSVDICSNCESAGLPGNLDSSDGGHVSSHIMIKIPFPVPITELQSASETAKLIIAGRDPTIIQDSRPRSRRNSFMSSRTILGSGPRSGDASSQDGTSSLAKLDHGVRCDECGQVIVGVRYQCGICPSLPRPYSLCAQCEEHSYALHDPMHIFFKLPRPVDRPLLSQSSILPKLYKRPAGPPEGSPSSYSPNPKEYLKELVHLKTFCDLCMSPITGVWYRCAYCAKDLCEVCEQMDTHDKTHIFFVLKSQVDMRILGYYANLDNSADSPPFLRYSVYNRH